MFWNIFRLPDENKTIEYQAGIVLCVCVVCVCVGDLFEKHKHEVSSDQMI